MRDQYFPRMNHGLASCFSVVLLMVTSANSRTWPKVSEEEVESYVRQYLPSILERSLPEPQTGGTVQASEKKEERVARTSDHSREYNTVLDDMKAKIMRSIMGKSNSSKSIDKREESNVDANAEDSKYIEEKLESLFPKLAKRLAKIDKVKSLFDVKSRETEQVRNVSSVIPPEISKALSFASIECVSVCDEFYSKPRTCWFNRQIGDTVTLKVRLTGVENINWTTGKVVVHWFKMHRNRDNPKDFEEKLPAGSVNESSNVVVGSGGTRLRISPIMDSDMDYNSFQATAKAVPFNFDEEGIKLADITFRINVVPIDMGFVYLGEELTISIHNYMTLPPGTLTFDWMMEKSSAELESLPPNMRVKNQGRTLVITELSSEQQGVIACAVYSADGLFMAKRRFTIRKPALPTNGIVQSLNGPTFQPMKMNVTTAQQTIR